MLSGGPRGMTRVQEGSSAPQIAVYLTLRILVCSLFSPNSFSHLADHVPITCRRLFDISIDFESTAKLILASGVHLHQLDSFFGAQRGLNYT